MSAALALQARCDEQEVELTILRRQLEASSSDRVTEILDSGPRTPAGESVFPKQRISLKRPFANTCFDLDTECAKRFRPLEATSLSTPQVSSSIGQYFSSRHGYSSQTPMRQPLGCSSPSTANIAVDPEHGPAFSTPLIRTHISPKRASFVQRENPCKRKRDLREYL